jgi:regulator of protease activity HflC (stomatin/prohibitin superfamily)
MSGLLPTSRLPVSRRVIAWVAAVALLAIIVLAFEPLVIVRAGYRGVLMRFGAVQQESLQPGLNVITPIVQSIVQMDTRIQKTQETEEAASHDLQDVHTTVATNWSIDPESAPQLYQTIGTVEQILDRLITPAISNTIKAVTAHYDAEQLITKRDQVAAEALGNLRQYLEPFHVHVAAVNIVNFAFSPDFARAIEAKQVAAQRAEQAPYELNQKRVSAQERVVEAEAGASAQIAAAKGSAQAAIEQARGDAQAIVLRANAQAEANAQISKSLDPAVLQWRALSTWNGQLPNFVGAGAPLPFISLDSRPPNEQK